MNKLHLPLLIYFFITSTALAALHPQDFAYGLRLTEPQDGHLYTLILPLVVYDKVVRSDMGDLRVFNAHNDLVPHSLRILVPHPGPANKQVLPFFPLPSASQRPGKDLHLLVQTKQNGTVVSVDAGHLPLSRASSSFLVDGSQLHLVPTALQFHWQGPSFAQVTISQSTDLMHWSPLVTEAVIANMQYGEHHIVRATVSLPKWRHPYIRLSFTADATLLHLARVTALSGASRLPLQWQNLPVLAHTRQNEELQYMYELNNQLALTGLQLELPQRNSLVRAVLESRPQPDQPWVRRASAVFYTLHLASRQLINPPLTISPQFDRYWRVRIMTDQAGLDTNSHQPTLKVGWPQREVLFIGRGPGPYTLAFGNAQLSTTEQQQDSLILAAIKDTILQAQAETVSPGPLLTLAGESARVLPPPPIAWTHMLLWLVLICGVVLMLLLARTLFKELARKET